MNQPGLATLTIERFERGDIDADTFDHAAHVYVAWLYLQRYEFAVAASKFDRAIKRLVKKFDADGKYHATITWFFVVLIGQESERGESWADFSRRNPHLLSNSKALLSQHYSDNVLFSARARQTFVLPDRSRTSDAA